MAYRERRKRRKVRPRRSFKQLFPKMNKIRINALAAKTDVILPVGSCKHEDDNWIMCDSSILEEHSDECELSMLKQCGKAVSLGSTVKMSYEFYIRLCTRQLGNDYARSLMMLQDMAAVPGLPEDFGRIVKNEIKTIVDVTGTELKLSLIHI